MKKLLTILLCLVAASAWAATKANPMTTNSASAYAVTGTAPVWNGSAWVFVGTNAFGGGGGTTNLTPWPSDINGAGHSLTNAGTVEGTNFVGNGSGLTNIPGSALQSPLIISQMNVSNLVVTNGIYGLGDGITNSAGYHYADTNQLAVLSNATKVTFSAQFNSSGGETNIASGALTTNLTIYGNASGTNWLTINDKGQTFTNTAGGSVVVSNGNVTASGQFNGNGAGLTNQIDVYSGMMYLGISSNPAAAFYVPFTGFGSGSDPGQAADRASSPTYGPGVVDTLHWRCPNIAVGTNFTVQLFTNGVAVPSALFTVDGNYGEETNFANINFPYTNWTRMCWKVGPANVLVGTKMNELTTLIRR